MVRQTNKQFICEILVHKFNFPAQILFIKVHFDRAKMHQTVLITGANRGIGLGLVKQFLQLDEPPEVLIAVTRDLSRSLVSGGLSPY